MIFGVKVPFFYPQEATWDLKMGPSLSPFFEMSKVIVG